MVYAFIFCLDGRATVDRVFDVWIGSYPANTLGIAGLDWGGSPEVFDNEVAVVYVVIFVIVGLDGEIKTTAYAGNVDGG